MLYERYLTSEYFDKGVMTAADVVGGGHSLSPTFLSNQIQRSLANLGLATIDVYYLHNPEQQRLALDGPRFRSVMRRRVRGARIPGQQGHDPLLRMCDMAWLPA